jgi:SAM-dependent methyltransferase
MARLAFAIRMVMARLNPARRHCPYCGSCLSHRLGRKWLLIEARQCVFCHLIFRYPTDGPAEARKFYERKYSGVKAWPLPGDAELRSMRAANFQGTVFDKLHRIRVLERFAANGKILDFGCSWGYSVAQLIEAGFDAVGYEPSQGRAEFGRQTLGVPIESAWETLLAQHSQRIGVVYADHVLEHVNDLRATLDGFARLLVPGGRLVLFVPNCGGWKARTQGLRWGPFLGEAHPVSFTADWFYRHLPRHGFAVETLGDNPDCVDSLPNGDELICVARRTALRRVGDESMAAASRDNLCADSLVGSIASLTNR